MKRLLMLLGLLPASLVAQVPDTLQPGTYVVPQTIVVPPQTVTIVDTIRDTLIITQGTPIWVNPYALGGCTDISGWFNRSIQFEECDPDAVPGIPAWLAARVDSAMAAVIPPSDTIIIEPDPPTVEAPGTAGQPQFTVVPEGIRVDWTAAARATNYQYSWQGATSAQSGTTPINSVVVLFGPAGGWFCVMPINSAGTATDQSCNSYTPQVGLNPAPDSLSVHPRSFVLEVGQQRQLYAVLWFGTTPTVCMNKNGEIGWGQVAFTDMNANSPIVNMSSSALFVQYDEPDAQCDPQLTITGPA